MHGAEDTPLIFNAAKDALLEHAVQWRSPSARDHNLTVVSCCAKRNIITRVPSAHEAMEFARLPGRAVVPSLDLGRDFVAFSVACGLRFRARCPTVWCPRRRGQLKLFGYPETMYRNTSRSLFTKDLGSSSK